MDRGRRLPLAPTTRSRRLVSFKPSAMAPVAVMSAACFMLAATCAIRVFGRRVRGSCKRASDEDTAGDTTPTFLPVVRDESAARAFVRDAPEGLLARSRRSGVTGSHSLFFSMPPLQGA